MSRNISTKQMQNVIADIRAWAHGDDCPEWAKEMILSIANVIEWVLVNKAEL